MRRRVLYGASFCVALSFGLLAASVATAVDFERFDFNDPPGTSLGGAANSANPGNLWAEDPGQSPSRMGVSDVRNGSYNIVKSSTALVPNYLQIDNITSGTRYLVAQMSGWNIVEDTPPTTEEFRLAFLNDDTGVSGSTITAQMIIRRNSQSREIELVGNALGDGSANIPAAPVLNTVQNDPFTMVLELDKTANSYKVFYKDGTDPTQVVGLGSVAPTRGGNSIRLAANGRFDAFSTDYPFEFFEIFSVDQIALTDTNPLTDLVSLDVNRETGSMLLRNTSGATIPGIVSYSITSEAGGLNPAGWNPQGTPTTSTSFELAADLAAPTFLEDGSSMSLSTGSGAWLQSPLEDLQMVLNLSGGGTRTVNVNFLENGGEKWQVGDLDFDGEITTADWELFIAGAETDLSGLSPVEAYQLGDLTGDGQNSIADFIVFKEAYNAANGAGAFEAMIAAVPEPTSALLLGAAALLIAGVSRRRGGVPALSARPTIASQDSSTPKSAGVAMTPRAYQFLSPLMIAAAWAAVAPTAHAVILEDFPFNDPNGTLLEDVENVANPGNNWLVHANTVESEVLDGAFRIQKQSATPLAGNSLDIDNITSGKAWLVAEIAGWHYPEDATGERVRFGFLDNDTVAAGSSFITAEMNIDRGTNGVQLNGSALGGGTSTPSTFAMPLTRTTPLTIALELDKDNDTYQVFYQEGVDPWGTIGSGNLGDSTFRPGTRAGNGIRFAIAGTFGGEDQFFDVGRIYLTDEDPIAGPVLPPVLALEVQSNGMVAIANPTGDSISFDSYRITSESSSLNVSGWNSLSSQGVDAVGGGVGQTWDEAGGSSDGVLAESFLLGSTTLAPDQFRTLGNAFQIGGVEDLVFEYHDSVTGSIALGDVEYLAAVGVPGDYNGDGIVNAADYSLWRDAVGTTTPLPNDPDGGVIGTAQYDTWKANFGMTSAPGSALAASAAVPEPSGWLLALLAVAGLYAGFRKRHMP